MTVACAHHERRVWDAAGAPELAVRIVTREVQRRQCAAQADVLVECTLAFKVGALCEEPAFIQSLWRGHEEESGSRRNMNTHCACAACNQEWPQCLCHMQKSRAVREL